jgi:hypothetical protein
VLPLQGKSAVFTSKVLQAKFGISLRKVKQSQCVAILNLLMIDSSLIEEAEGAPISLEGPIVIAIRTWSFLERFIYLLCLSQTAETLLVILSIDVTESEHVVYHYEVLIERLCFLGR